MGCRDGGRVGVRARVRVTLPTRRPKVAAGPPAPAHLSGVGGGAKG